MKKVITILIIFIVSSINLAGCSAKGGESEKNLVTVSLKLKWKHQFQFAGYYIAKEKGFYEEAGLNVIIEDASGQEEALQTVLDGNADIGIGSSDLVISFIEEKPIVVLGTLFQHSPLVLIANQSSNIEKIHDIVGKRVMLESHSEELIAYFRDEGIRTEELILYPHSFDVEPFIVNDVDAMSAYITDEPYLLSEQGIDIITFSPRMGGIDFYADTLFTRQKYARENPEIIQAFLDASKQGWNYAFDHVDETIVMILNDYSKRHSYDHLAYEAEMMNEYVLPDIVEIGYMNPGRWEHIAETYSSLGMVPEDYSLEGFLFVHPDDRTSIPFNVIVVGVLITAAILVLIIFSHGFTKLFFLVRDKYPKIYKNLNTNYE